MQPDSLELQSRQGATSKAPNILERSRKTGTTFSLSYAGGISSQDACTLFSEAAVVFVDVRTEAERKFVGHIPGSLHLPWQLNATLTVNPHFIRDLDRLVHKDTALLFICHNGKRSSAAATAASRAGFTGAFDMFDGFEGDVDASQTLHSTTGLPWVQD